MGIGQAIPHPRGQVQTQGDRKGASIIIYRMDELYNLTEELLGLVANKLGPILAPQVEEKLNRIAERPTLCNLFEDMYLRLDKIEEQIYRIKTVVESVDL